MALRTSCGLTAAALAAAAGAGLAWLSGGEAAPEAPRFVVAAPRPVQAVAPQAAVPQKPARSETPPSPAAPRAPQLGDMPIEPIRLSAVHPQTAAHFLRQVRVLPSERGGFEVQAVAPETLYARLGLRPGDRVYTLDTESNLDVDENSMISLMLVTTVELDVVRDGQPLRLRLALNEEDAPDGAAEP
ncbi:MAG TPA: hypothetical protein VLA61_14605 [Ideonella sp.]|uniref:hypothetical protein n=1 Tax=Ideonella sp. TaxID=1929293 RepID=UPI002B8DFC32|nr:hypothetical protein [Ideonella sp.]HSI49501.1 hypothetical protein [Ideonella sp.]